MFRSDNFTPDSQEIAAHALELMERLKHTRIDTEHILLALIEQKGGIVPYILHKANLNAGALRMLLADNLRRSPRVAPAPRGKSGKDCVTPEALPLFDAAAAHAKSLGDRRIAPEHLLLGIMDSKATRAGHILKEAGLTREQVMGIIREQRAERAQRASRRPRPRRSIRPLRPGDHVRPPLAPHAFARYSAQAQDVAARALEIGQRYHHTQVDVEHLMLALLEQPESTIGLALEILMMDPGSFKHTLDQSLIYAPPRGAFAPHPDRVFVTPRVHKVLDNAQSEMQMMGEPQISVEHILLGILDEGCSLSADVLKEKGLTRDLIVETVRVIRANTFG